MGRARALSAAFVVGASPSPSLAASGRSSTGAGPGGASRARAGSGARHGMVRTWSGGEKRSGGAWLERRSGLTIRCGFLPVPKCSGRRPWGLADTRAQFDCEALSSRRFTTPDASAESGGFFIASSARPARLGAQRALEIEQHLVPTRAVEGSTRCGRKPRCRNRLDPGRGPPSNPAGTAQHRAFNLDQTCLAAAAPHPLPSSGLFLEFFFGLSLDKPHGRIELIQYP